MEKLQRQLKKLVCKKESLFRRAQTLQDMIPSLSDEKSHNTFLVSSHTLNRKDFEAIIDEINDIELELNDKFIPNYECLTAFDTLFGSIQIAISKLCSRRKDNYSLASTSAIKNTDNSELSISNKVNLPTLQIKSFKGDIKDWIRFRELFTSLIINNTNLSDVEKLHYLISSVSDKPADIIKNYSLSDYNFEPAWNALKERYESDRVLASHYFEELIAPPNVPAKPNLEFLHYYLSKINDNVCGLKQMKLNDISDFILFSIAIRQLDPVTRKSFEGKNGSDSIPTYDSLISFIKNECRLLEITNSVSYTASNQDVKKINSDSINRKYTLTKSPSAHKVVFVTQGNSSIKPESYHKTSIKTCPLGCADYHQLYYCPQFLNLNTTDRHAVVKKHYLCFNCLGSHRVSLCKSTRNCFCSKRHHKLLHFSTPKISCDSSTATQSHKFYKTGDCDEFSSTPAQLNPPGCSKASAHTLATISSVPEPSRTTSILLGTACAMIKNNQGKYIRFRLLVDCASTSSFITKSLVEKLGLCVKPCTQTFTGLSDNPVGSSLGVANCHIRPIQAPHPNLSARALVVGNILKNVPLFDLPDESKHFVKGLSLADPYFYRSHPVDMLLGCDILPKVLISESVPPLQCDIGVLPSVFGHILIGSIPVTVNTHHNNISLLTCSANNVDSDRQLSKLVERFWESEKITATPISNPEDEFCEQHFVKTHKRDPSGRYSVQMPFKCDPCTADFSGSKQVAIQRFYSLEARFRRHPHLKNDCVKFLKEYEKLGHMKKTRIPGKYYIPYFCVFNPNSPTTPTRVVFDGSAKQSGIAINDILFPGPKLQHEVPDVVMNFRVEKFVFCCDVTKMYRQISLHPTQRPYTHILFREDPSQPIEEYELSTVTYGLTPSSFLSHRTLIQLIQDEGHKYPLAVPILQHNSVVDDFFGGSNTVEGLIETKDQLSALLLSGGFPLNKWLSNSPELLDNLQKSDSSGTLVIRNDDDQNIKILGIGWNPKRDVFFFSLDKVPFKSTYTKRNVLSTIARIYDPLGFAAPTIFLFKHLLKEIWMAGVGWDDPIPPFLATQWHQCLCELPELCSIQIPRCIFSSSPQNVHVLGFCDGSMKGSAAAVYIRVQFSDRVEIFLLKSKTRVAPSKPQTIPRLELIGAVLLTTLIKSILPFLSNIPLTNYRTSLFCDSTIVISWIRKPPHLLKLFVSNRVSTILEYTSVSQWNHIPSECNISDAASRGVTPRGLVSLPEWFQGPSWALQPEEHWPVNTFTPVSLDCLPEIKNNISLNLTTCEVIETVETPPWLNKFSHFGKLQRVIAYVLRFLHNSHNPLNKYFGPLSINELNRSLITCIRCDQNVYFKSDISKLKSQSPCSTKIQRLSPFLDQNNLIRVGGRLAHSDLAYDSKYPILLSNNSFLTRLLISYYHVIYLHSGSRTLQALLSSRFWILNTRQIIRKVLYSCVRCARFRRTTVSPTMGELPAARVTPNRPFLNCSVDLAGPYTLKESLRRNARTYKAYFALFICFSVKAVHVEILSNLTSDCFIAALNRFTSRRGLPAHIYCDQATNFKGASNQLSSIVQFLLSTTTNEILKNYFTSQNIKFDFSVPRAPFMNGLAESNIKNVKRHLTRVVGNQVLTFEEFSTITTRIEAILNSRPLCCTSSSPDELQALTPGHFLIGAPLLAIPEDNLEEVPVGRLSRWQLVNQIARSLWKRWEQEYLHTLQNKAKWFNPEVNMKTGQLVWLKEDNSPPLSYPLARIVQLHPGIDGVVRVVSVKTQNGIYRRSVRKMAPLPIS